MTHHEQHLGHRSIPASISSALNRPGRWVRATAASALAMGLLAGALVGGCRSSSGTTHTGGPVNVTDILANNFVADWRAELPLQGTQIKKLSLSEDKVFAETTDNRAYWLDRKQGRVIAMPEVARPQDKLYGAIPAGKQVVFPSTNQLRVYDQHGRFSHSISLQYDASSPGVGDSKNVYIGVRYPHGGAITDVDLEKKPYPVTTVWDLLTPNGDVVAAPALFQGMLFAGSRDGGVYAVRAENREPLWSGLDPAGLFRTGGPIVADMKADRDGVYAASTDSKLYCLDLNSGRIRWMYYSGQPLREQSSPVPTPSQVYIYVPEVGFVAIDKAGKQEIRKPKWVIAEGRQFLAADEKNVYLQAADNSILAADKQSGQVLFRSKRTDLTVFAQNPKIGEAVIYGATPSGTVLAIRPLLRGSTVGELVLDAQPLQPVAVGR